MRQKCVKEQIFVVLVSKPVLVIVGLINGASSVARDTPLDNIVKALVTKQSDGLNHKSSRKVSGGCV